MQKHSGGDVSLLLFFNKIGLTIREHPRATEMNRGCVKVCVNCLKQSEMIDKSALADFIEKQLEGSDLYLVELTVSNQNEITVEIDSDTSVDIDRCVELSRKIEEAFNRDEEDYELEVGSSGLTSPFKVRRQYEKYIGNEVEVLASDGKKYKGILRSAGDETFTIQCEEKVRQADSKRPVVMQVEKTFRYDEVKYTKYLLQF